MSGAKSGTINLNRDFDPEKDRMSILYATLEDQVMAEAYININLYIDYAKKAAERGDDKQLKTLVKNLDRLYFCRLNDSDMKYYCLSKILSQIIFKFPHLAENFLDYTVWEHNGFHLNVFGERMVVRNWILCGLIVGIFQGLKKLLDESPDHDFANTISLILAEIIMTPNENKTTFSPEEKNAVCEAVKSFVKVERDWIKKDEAETELNLRLKILRDTLEKVPELVAESKFEQKPDVFGQIVINEIFYAIASTMSPEERIAMIAMHSNSLNPKGS
jgi:hypothetical protein